MGLFSFFKKSAQVPTQTSINPYKDSSANFIYNLVFCDNPDLYKEKTQPSNLYPYDILFAETSSITDLQKIIDDQNADPGIKVLAYNRQLATGYKPGKKELLGVIVEVGLDGGLDVLASFENGTARYINHTENVLILETTDDEAANKITNELFAFSEYCGSDRPLGQTQTTQFYERKCENHLSVSDGLYFGEGPINTLFNDPMVAPALAKATELMQYLTRKSLDKK